ncbi:alkaline phosphatase family protein [Haloferula sp.]|uniref:alkaline phosphatase family protein n=1 Tax=Haloferula sp. TaxID=2497595 RepID=UPI00329E045F
MMIRRLSTTGLVSIGALLLSSCDKDKAGDEEVRLVLQITVDGLRGDFLELHKDQLGPDGFRRLMNSGVHFTNAHYHHANTETVVGHSTLATGAPPAVHGMIGNAWYDRRSGQLGYNFEDAGFPLLKTRETTAEVAELDPSKQGVRSNGRSPGRLLAPTFSDTLRLATDGEAKVFAVSGKDRGAIPMAGQGGKAFWFSTSSTDFVTSEYYYEDYPEWTKSWNGKRLAEAYADTEWELSGEPGDYRRIAHDERAYEVDLGGFKRSFPHPYGPANHPLFPTRLLTSSAGDELVADFAATLLEAEELGKDGTPDFLAVSFSSVDAVNHFFGPGSLECEETLRQLDRTLAEFLKKVDQVVGLDRTLVVLSADHGMPVMPEYAVEIGFPAGRLQPQEVVDAANAAASELGVEDAVKTFFRPYLYLDHEAIIESGVDKSKLLEQVTAAIEDIEGVRLAVASDTPPSDAPRSRISSNHHPDRSGDVYVAQEPYWFLFDKGPVACMHGSPWSYDTHVPVIFSGPRLSRQQVGRSMRPADIAPSLSAALGLGPPAMATGEILEELGGSNP